MNRTELQQVLINLIVNAIHAMPGGGTLTMMGDAWDDWQSRTSYWPRFGKLVQAGATAWIGGLLIWLGATYGHIHANGMPAGIWRGGG